MRLIKPSYQILNILDANKMLSLIEDAGRTCYKSEGKKTKKSYLTFISMLLNKQHESVIEHATMTVRFIIDRGVSHELVRHRLASYSQESTRYCNYSKGNFDNQLTFIIPNWWVIPEGEFTNITQLKNFTVDALFWIEQMFDTERRYLALINKGYLPQQARSILPNSLKTEIVMTANFREWRTVFKQRCSTAAHPQMREVMIPLLKECQKEIPIIFDDISI